MHVYVHVHVNNACPNMQSDGEWLGGKRLRPSAAIETDMKHDKSCDYYSIRDLQIPLTPTTYALWRLTASHPGTPSLPLPPTLSGTSATSGHLDRFSTYLIIVKECIIIVSSNSICWKTKSSVDNLFHSNICIYINCVIYHSLKSEIVILSHLGSIPCTHADTHTTYIYSTANIHLHLTRVHKLMQATFLIRTHCFVSVYAATFNVLSQFPNKRFLLVWCHLKTTH